MKSLKCCIWRAFSAQCRTCAYELFGITGVLSVVTSLWFVIGFVVMEYSLYFSKWWEKFQSRVFLWKRSILQRKHFWKIQIISVVTESTLCISLSIKWLMCAYGNFFKVFDSVRLKNVHQLQQYILSCWTLHICFAIYCCYLFVNVILSFWGEEFPGSWRRRKEKDSF